MSDLRFPSVIICGDCGEVLDRETLRNGNTIVWPSQKCCQWKNRVAMAGIEDPEAAIRELVNLRKEKEVRHKYQSLVYDAMNILDKPGDVRKGKGVTADTFLERIRALKDQARGHQTEQGE